MAEDPHYYVAGYSVEDDPYSQPNGVLINNFGIDNTRDLEEIEAASAALAIQELLKQPLHKISTFYHSRKSTTRSSVMSILGLESSGR